jgi:hypothetical protein
VLRRGWRGHHEVLTPTLLYQNGFRLRDFGGDGSFVAPGEINAVYTSLGSSSGCLSVHGTLRFRPSRLSPGLKSGMLYHPVKPISLMEPLDRRLTAYRYWQRELSDEFARQRFPWPARSRQF